MAKLNANSVELGSLTTTQRNALTSVSTGTVIYNTSNSQIEVWDGNQWIGGLTTPLAATGGTTDSSTRPGYIVHTFTGDGTFTVTSGSGTAEYLLVAGGGGGGKNNFPDGAGRYGCGGGGGGLVYVDSWTLTPGPYAVSVGDGGGVLAGGSFPSTANEYPGRFGGTSSIASAPIPSVGGGGGGPGHYGPEATGIDDRPGGVSMGGGGNKTIRPSSDYGPGAYTGDPGGTTDSNSPSDGWGNEGGPNAQAPSPGWGSAGGGGAGNVGSDGNSSNGGGGGAGLTYGISGTPTVYAGGGGGGPNGPGGSGGGGSGARTNGAAGSGTANRGGGGGGNTYTRGNSSGGPGGSGIVIIAYQTS